MLKHAPSDEQRELENKETGAQSHSQGQKGRQLEMESVTVVQTNALIESILQDPVGFISNPLKASKEYNDSDLSQAYAYFSSTDPSRYAYGVCSSFFHNRFPRLQSQLFALGMSDFPKSRFWPFWKDEELTPVQSTSQDEVEKHLLDLWNRDPEKYPSMFHQTGFLSVEDRAQLENDVFFFKCALPIYRNGGRKPATLTFAFDAHTRGFYSINARIRFEPPEFRFRYIDFINPNVSPPKAHRFLEGGTQERWKVLLVLDRHIGDNLSLFSTHIKYLARNKNIELTLDTSLCPLFSNAQRGTLERLLPASSSVNLAGPLPPNREEYNLVFDPYDWVSGVFHLKPQNDSAAISILSSIALARSYTRKLRRDILEIHMGSLKHLGVVPHEEPTPDFISYQVQDAERVAIRHKARSKLLGTSSAKQSLKIVTLFPFGLTTDRRYPTDSLQILIQKLLTDPQIHVVLAGAEFDTQEIVQAVRSDWRGVIQPCGDRLKVYLSEPLSDLIDLMLASDAIVCMDSGPLHVARALRLRPIALYTKKINNEDYYWSFPWLVEDGTAETFKPERDDDHVAPNLISDAVLSRLSCLRLQ